MEKKELEALLKSKTAEEIVEILKKEGRDVSLEQVKKWQSGELDDPNLDVIAGGFA